MKKILALAVMACSLSGCIVVPAGGGYYHPAYRYRPAPYHYYYGY